MNDTFYIFIKKYMYSIFFTFSDFFLIVPFSEARGRFYLYDKRATLIQKNTCYFRLGLIVLFVPFSLGKLESFVTIESRLKRYQNSELIFLFLRMYFTYNIESNRILDHVKFVMILDVSKVFRTRVQDNRQSNSSLWGKV